MLWVDVDQIRPDCHLTCDHLGSRFPYQDLNNEEAMKLHRCRTLFLISLLACLAHSGTCEVNLFAADGTWIVDADGHWSDAGNWSNSIIADGANSTANFTTSQPQTIALDISRTIGNLNFLGGDSVSPWQLNSVGASILTLARTGEIPTIDVLPNAAAIATTSQVPVFADIESNGLAAIIGRNPIDSSVPRQVALHPGIGQVVVNAQVAGNGGLKKTGSGTLALRGENVYSGGTILAAGTLEIREDHNLGNAAAPLVFNGAAEKTLSLRGFFYNFTSQRSVEMKTGGPNQVFVSAYTTWAGLWSGEGSFTIRGSRPLTLTGNNTYTGTVSLSGTGIDQGTLRAIDGVGLSPLSNLAFAGGVLETKGIFTRSIGTGPGQVQWTSGGGFGTYGGSLRIRLNGGTDTVTVGSLGFIADGQKLCLEIGDSGNLLDFQNSIDLNGSSLTVDTGSSVSRKPYARLSGALSNGNLNVAGGGLVLTGLNTYQDTNIMANELHIGDGGTTGTLGTGEVYIESRALVFNRSDSMVVPNTIIGFNAGVTQAGTGVVVLTGDTSGLERGSFSALRGILAFDYSDTTLQNPLKLGSQTGIEIGSAELILAGGNVQETARDLRVSGDASLSRTSGTSIIALNSINRDPGGTLELSEDNLATTTNVNVNGVLPGVIVAGRLAKVSAAGTGGSIIALSDSDYVPIPRSGGMIVDGTSQLKIVDGSGDGQVAPAAFGTTTINTITHAASDAPAIIDIGAGNSLRLGTVGSVVLTNQSSDLRFQNGMLTAGGAEDVSGEILFNNNGPNAITVDSTIADNGAGVVRVTKSGSGTLYLNAPNSYSGPTYISNGVLVISEDKALGQAIYFPEEHNLLLNGGTLRTTTTMSTDYNRRIGIGPAGGTFEVDANTVLTIARGISMPSLRYGGIADLTKTGGGKLILAGRGSYDSTYVEEGSLEVGGYYSGTLGSGEVTLAADTELIFNRYDDLPVNAEISGSGKVTQAGPGRTILGGANTYTGPTSVLAGTLLVNGSLTGTSITVAAGASLGGTGEINGPITIEGGTLAPGASIGIMNVGGLSLSPSSVFNPELSLAPSLAADLLNVTGQLTLGGATLSLDFLDSPTPQAFPLTFLLANNDLDDPIAGAFSTISAPIGFLASVDYAYSGTDAIGRIGNGNDLAITITAVPEPAAVTLSLGAWLSVIAYRRRRK
jgi:fibronectin-binding autotransporter adhesin